jgi:hypothetical protein
VDFERIFANATGERNINMTHTHVQRVGFCWVFSPYTWWLNYDVIKLQAYVITEEGIVRYRHRLHYDVIRLQASVITDEVNVSYRHSISTMY